MHSSHLFSKTKKDNTCVTVGIQIKAQTSMFTFTECTFLEMCTIVEQGPIRWKL